jgi:hypothetical protein
MPTRPSVASRKRAVKTPGEKMLRAVEDYLESMGWLCLLPDVEGIQVPHDLERIPGTDNFNFELVIRFTGKKMNPDADPS